MNRVRTVLDNGLPPILGCCKLEHYKQTSVKFFIKMQNFSFTKIDLKISSAKCRPWCPGGYGLKLTETSNPGKVQFIQFPWLEHQGFFKATFPFHLRGAVVGRTQDGYRWRLPPAVVRFHYGGSVAVPSRIRHGSSSPYLQLIAIHDGAVGVTDLAVILLWSSTDNRILQFCFKCFNWQILAYQ